MSTPTAPRRHHILSELALSLATLALVGLALGAHRPLLVPILFVSVAVVVVITRKCLPSATFVSTTLAIGIPLYMCIYALLAVKAFEGSQPALAYIGCLLPLIAFTACVWWRRDELNRSLDHRRVEARTLARGIGWVAFAAAIISVSGEVAAAGDDAAPRHEISMIIGMAAVSLLVAAVIADLVVLLAVTGHLFTTFIERMIRRAVPVFAFLLVYCFLVIIFGALYSILDEVTGRPHFSLNGTMQPLDLGDAIYFSMVTMSTIGYGDILATTSAARTLAVLEIISGVVLFLFAFAEIAAYDPEAEQALGNADESKGGEKRNAGKT